MSKRKLNTEQIIGVVKQLEAGRTAVEMARVVWVSQALGKRGAFNRW